MAANGSSATAGAPSPGWIRCYFAFFFLSGFCSLVYEVVWLRLAMARFGVTTPLVSMVLSLFMAGLAFGSWFAGRVAKVREGRPASHFLRLYALTELLIGVAALTVPLEFECGHRLLAGGGGGSEWGSLSFYLASGAVLAIALLPFCTCMGMTYPLAMSAIRRTFPEVSGRSFSYLYLANVLGACTGTLVSAFLLIEMFGFHRTLGLTAVLNLLVAAGALALSMVPPGAVAAQVSPRGRGEVATAGALSGGGTLTLLFMTGLASLAMEVVWIRQFAPHLGPLVYSFGAILAIYLAATAFGSWWYRASSRPTGGAPTVIGWQMVLALVGCSALLPLVTADPRLPVPAGFIPGAFRVLVGIGPFCASLGFLTPLLVDRWAGGNADRAGRAYAVNVIGCILGPLLAGFLLLPALGERGTLVVLSLPLLTFGVWGLFTRSGTGDPAAPRRGAAWGTTAAVVAVGLLFVLGTKGFETNYPGGQVRRDYTATIIAAGEGRDKVLVVNGIGITNLGPVTKMMAHLPAAFLPTPPREGLVICFGMGTTFRSLRTWGGSTTAVELVPSVPSLFGFFHADGPALLQRPGAQVVIDDGRRFLERTPKMFDVIAIDPPPPIDAAASSLLYSRDFYEVLRTRLAPGGILQQWVPQAEPIVRSAIARALTQSFPHVRAFVSVEGWGVHFLSSAVPILEVSAEVLASRLSPASAADLVEWGPYDDPVKQFQAVLQREIPIGQIEAEDAAAPVLSDDVPVNEYFLLRRLRGGPRAR